MWQLFLMFLITTIAGELLRPKPKFNAPKPSALGEFQFPTAEYGRAVPVVYGECHLKGPNVTWWGDLRTNAITEEVDTGWFSSDTITKGYEYYMGCHLVFCKGFSAWELQNGSGLVELRFDDKRPTAVSGNVRYPIGQLIPPDGQAFGAIYRHTEMNASDANSRFTRVYIHNDFLYGGPEKEGGVHGTIDFHYGQQGAVRNDYLQSVFGTADVPAYRGYCHAVMRQCYIGTTSYPKAISAIVRRYPWFWNTANGWQVGYDANPVAIVVDLMTNADYGLGIPMSQIGASFQSAAMTCFNEGTGLSMTFDNQSPAKDLIAEVLRHIDGVAYTDPATGLYEIAMAREDYDIDTVLELDPDNVLKLEMTRPSWGETKNIVKIKYINAENNYSVSVLEQKNQSNIYIRGGVKDEETFEFLGISSTAVANKIAARVLRTVSHPLARFHMTVTRAAYDLRPGSVFALTWPELGIDQMACRVTRISYGSLTEPHITLEAVEDIFGVLETKFAAPPASEWQNPVTNLTINAAERLVEAPFHLVGGEDRKVMTLASRSSYLAQGYKVQSSPDGTPVITSTVPRFTPSGRLVANYATGQVAIDSTGFEIYDPIDGSLLDTITDAQRLKGLNLLLIDDELMTFSTVTQTGSGYRISGVARGVLDTVQADHAAGARVWFISEGLGLVQSAGYTADKTVTAKLLPYDQSRTVDAAAAAQLSVTTNSRAKKPYPVGRLRVNSLAYAARTTDDAVFTFAHRPRRQLLADGRIVDDDYEGYGTGEGTYTVEVKVGGVTRRTQAGLTSAAFTYTAAQRALDDADGTKTVTFSITSVENGLTSATRTTAPFLMTGLGMGLGEVLGGEQA